MPCTTRVLRWTAVFAACCLAASPEQVEAAPPAEQSLRYTVRQDPTDARSDVLFSLQVRIQPVAWDTKRVAWRIAELWIIEPGRRGQDRVWRDATPPLMIWWVQHEDIAKPVGAEFTSTPQWIGQARAMGHDAKPLDYRFGTEPLELPPEGRESPMAAATYRVIPIQQAASDPPDGDGGEPNEEGEDEPIEIDDEPEDIDDPEDIPIDS